jgi:hypothetical protein
VVFLFKEMSFSVLYPLKIEGGMKNNFTAVEDLSS